MYMYVYIITMNLYISMNYFVEMLFLLHVRLRLGMGVASMTTSSVESVLFLKQLPQNGFKACEP